MDDPQPVPLDSVVTPQSQGINIAPDISPIGVAQLTLEERVLRIESTLNLT